MKKTILIAVTSLLMFSCGPSAEDQKKKCLDLLDNSAMKEFYMEAYLKGWHDNVEACGQDVDCLTKCYDMLLDKAAEAEAEIMLKKAGVE